MKLCPYFYFMKRAYLIVIALAGVSAFFLSAGSLITPAAKPAFPEKEVAIALRHVGHQVMLHAGDSVSRILPVKRSDESTFRLEFQGPFTFVPDSLVKIVQQSIASTSVELAYTVNVLDCSSREIVYGFQIGLQKQTTLVPCLGREQPQGCYIIIVSFLQDERVASHERSYLFILALASLAVVAYVGRAYTKNSKPPFPEAGNVSIGKYEFYAERRMLKFGNTVTDLSDKETKLLTLFVDHKNQPVLREHLMKEVWQDDGVLISRSLDVFVSRLRKKLKDDPSLQLMNIHGVGYKLLC